MLTAGALRDTFVRALAAALTVGMGTSIPILLGIPARDAAITSVLTALVAGAVAVGVAGWNDRRLASVRAKQLTIVERLTEKFARATTHKDVRSLVEQTVHAAIPATSARFASWPRGSSPAPEPLDPNDPAISLRTRLDGEPVSLLRVKKTRNAAFTHDEVEVLRTIASQASLALACIEQVQSLELRRREQARAWESERAAVIEALAAEIAHEVRYPINFFRSIFNRRGEQQQLDAEELDIGCEEVERLERLVAGLRRVAVRHLERKPARVTEIIARAEVLLRDRLDGRSFDTSISDQVRVRCDPDQITQVLVNLMSNAVSATKNGAKIGIDWTEVDTGAHLTVWDRGEGFVCPPSVIFTPWFTTKSTGTGLGLAITHRIVRAHGWAIDAAREEDRTNFVIFIPDSDIVAASSPPSHDQAREQQHGEAL